jgi:hypothetical protein
MFSVTNESCKCGLIEKLADNPDMPIVFDTKTNEYHFKYAGGHLSIYQCILCGGKLPDSRRVSLFHVISDDEKSRL